MSKNNREIELKYIVDVSNLNWPMATVGARIRSMPGVNVESYIDRCSTVDHYFNAPNKSIVRLRESLGVLNTSYRPATHKHLKEITIKQKDKGNNFDRIEENVAIDNPEIAMRALELLFGYPVVTIYKKEEVFFLEGGVVISLAEINGKPEIYLEIEGPTEASVLAMALHFESTFTLKRETRSLFEIATSINVVV